MLDDGRITDGQGRTVNFRNTIIILTSNIGSQAIVEAGGDLDKQDEVRLRVLDMLRGTYRPEFLNRLDEIVLFNPLQKVQLRTIARLSLGALTGRLSNQEVGLEVSDAAVDVLTDLGYRYVTGRIVSSCDPLKCYPTDAWLTALRSTARNTAHAPSSAWCSASLRHLSRAASSAATTCPVTSSASTSIRTPSRCASLSRSARGPRRRPTSRRGRPHERLTSLCGARSKCSVYVGRGQTNE